MGSVLKSSSVFSLLFAFTLWLNAFTVYAGEPKASLHLEPSVSTTTAGQQIELALTIRHDEGIEVIFNPQQQSWGEMEFLSSHTSARYWVNGQWQYIVYMDTAFLIPGQYQTPVFTADVFDDSQHWELDTAALPLHILSSFDDSPVDVQDTVGLPQRQTETSYFSLFLVMLAMVAVLTSVLFHQRRRKALPVQQHKALSASDIATQADEAGMADWEALRHWLMVTTGADPVGKLTTSEPLLHRYQFLRFGRTTRLDDFIEFCDLCQKKWGQKKCGQEK
ncbi:hypothetical protein GZ77_25510 [Endozoicomonas montiporae]|uniref:Uncharacterized protein n=2 Tax=Endozoicomonas montiporae TaxID=1027273 RepID=A0A081MZ37_9GAMM|nr:hypothetical protein [Endozoicomonas montiporae]AMO54933.1 hypothetical protein EZMO1_0696 [Endozoicomonas montiporae CL-33]KEQ11460.1 hypothetical protein GZ77_25510 [Endozoicomonas montiporae]